jgi:hypothetical protein
MKSDGHAKKDLRDSVTLFVTTVGYPTFRTCLDYLAAQDAVFTLKTIDHVAPMSAALQRMLDDCTTPYYIQVDEDMLLYPYAVRTLHDRISTADPEVAQYVSALWDVHVERAIYGLKIYRHAIASRYPYRNVNGCEWDQVRRLRADGYVDVRATLKGATRNSADTMGLHGTYWTPHAAYLRYCALELKRRKGNRSHQWLVESAHYLLDRFLLTRSQTDFYGLMGMIAASFSNSNTVGVEKDYREYDRTPGFHHLRRFVEEVEQGWHEGASLRPGEWESDVLERGLREPAKPE